MVTPTSTAPTMATAASKQHALSVLLFVGVLLVLASGTGGHQPPVLPDPAGSHAGSTVIFAPMAFNERVVRSS